MKRWVFGCAAVFAGATAVVASSASARDTETVAPRVIDRFLRARGVVEPVSGVAEVRANVDGTVRRVLVREGDVVEAGALLVEMDSPRLELEKKRRAAEALAARAKAELARSGPTTDERTELDALETEARAAFAQADDEAKRADKLAQAGVLSEAARNEAATRQAEADARLRAVTARRAQRLRGEAPEVVREASRRAEAAALTSALAELEASFAEVRAPRAGVVTKVHIHEGDTVSRSVESARVLVEIADPSEVLVRVEVGEVDALEPRPGQTVTISLQGGTAVIARGTVARVSPRLEPSKLDVSEGIPSQVRPIWLQVAAEGNAPPLLLDQKVDVKIALEPIRVAAAVRRAAVRVSEGAATVAVRRGPFQQNVPVRLGVGDAEWIQVEGLAVGTPVCVPRP
ncbi:HlyD family efflux transporter periplasmic adaptor subunit [Polyangium sp. y55x31]|uniref:HlyD family secretion protein n=1 Tax=Polyangium sp. y55x31 TaxID=3042688 RepID=UPI002482B073|nr:HlyD family efflux transporter periplasmic adaptor subunit [Polyangium sp. y55x31]MDI1480362.1 HlyD family efflux transporter periplasmic adaptor subunit [Polyangium sp. y55x31]